MENKKEWKISNLLKTAAILGILAALALGAFALAPNVAQAQEDETPEPSEPMLGMRGFHAFGRHGGMMFGGELDYDTFLADALGITVEELEIARQTANEAAIAEAVARGYLSEEQAEMIQARNALKAYIDENALLAEALGISVDELQAAREEGTRLPTLIEELGLEAADVRASLQTAYDAAVQGAVDAGVITQEQADQIQNCKECLMLFGSRRDFGRHNFFRGERMPCTPESGITEDNGL